MPGATLALLSVGSLPVLQAADRFADATEVVLFGYEFVGAALGLFVAYLAYRGTGATTAGRCFSSRPGSSSSWVVRCS